jgi:hypothetical protein
MDIHDYVGMRYCLLVFYNDAEGKEEAEDSIMLWLGIA